MSRSVLDVSSNISSSFSRSMQDVSEDVRHKMIMKCDEAKCEKAGATQWAVQQGNCSLTNKVRRKARGVIVPEALSKYT